ncbi:NADPH:quinone oxidoreductase family protein [Microbulbifer thermotolerans]|uniref:NADPH:quinone oxidoreductase n=1 Tax=Microbulbifer thermotolerans TaxID=252514 RepID=A0A143HMK7_MICTH|nr:NADPH:quinone oxidoreductase family protein [Microbulbifer thermotolerans]AMX02928.1 NADPH:quinone oxidoreductase [Microbulbifer thermotolerans]MCX2779841.1 NADPH:quinone oxidoreductase family protein [Microbulbifer thermotolerans]MCX2781638.1 NADPH:quinone oxidoreductase family protein [Microbulbifer thermotolerans]MCX2794797.1 NADPH:quinone oxidoreductase family protein [Microbulbifer thermotolerans]MCX2802295.1 NADPH:quinone oxidoreductase family protein [Microbulbifer thermotolerans]
MRALICREYGTAEQLVIGDQALPPLKNDEVRIDVRAAGINFPDTLIIAGKYQIKPPLPFIPGGECAGVVSAVGDAVTSFKVGDRVIAMPGLSAFAEQVQVKSHLLVPMPDKLSFEQAAGFCITYATSYYALKQRAALEKGETLVVLGAAGGVGVTAIQLGKALGARVIACASSDDRLAFCREVGADDVINYSRENLKERIKALTDGQGADVILDPVGGDYTEQAYRSIAWSGRYLVIGFASGDIPRLPLNLPLLKAGDIMGIFWGSWAQRDPQANLRNFAELLQMVEDGSLNPLTTEVYPFEEYARAFASITERRARGKVILVIG